MHTLNFDIMCLLQAKMVSLCDYTTLQKHQRKKMVGNMDLMRNGWVIGLKSKRLLETSSCPS